MEVTIYTHYDETEAIAGTFEPAGDGVLAETITAETIGDDGVRAEWSGTKCGVKIIERQRRSSDERELAVWVSVTDKQGTVHTVEAGRDSPDLAFGYLTVNID